MNKKRVSKIWSFTNDEFKDIVDSSCTYGEILDKCGIEFNYVGGYAKTIKKRMVEDNLSFEELEKRRKSHLSEKGKSRTYVKKELSEILVENSTFYTNPLKKRLISEGILKNECSLCGLGDTWNGNSITLQLDHINGVYNDHRLENLRILCPNCHSQTDNFTGRNKKSVKVDKVDKVDKVEKKYFCSNDNCKVEISKHSKKGLCRACSRDDFLKINSRYIEDNNLEKIYNDVLELGFSEVSRKLALDGINYTPNGLKKKLLNNGFDLSVEILEYHKFKKTNTGLKCVLLDRKKSIDDKYLVSIWFNNKTNYFGCYETREEAAKVADEKMVELFGPDVLTNKKLGLIDY